MMHLSEELKKRYTKEKLSVRESQRIAEFIAFGPVVFQVSRLMLKWGILEILRDEELTSDEIAERIGISKYAAKCVMEASLTIGTVLVNVDSGKYTISKIGWFLVNDPATIVNIDFNHDVNYLGMFDLEKALKEGRPAGLKQLGNWPTIYEGLSTLPEAAKSSWFAFDHFYSDSSFDEALKIVFASSPKTLMDVGGNTGRWAMQCVTHDKNVDVTIVDLPQQLDMMHDNISGKEGSDRIHVFATNLLDEQNSLPDNSHWDVIWMSQFLDCFSEEEILSILKRAVKVMDEDSTMYIMETLWNRQKYEPAAFCLTQISLYFTAMANGNSKMYGSDELMELVDKAGLKVEKIHGNLGQGHSILCCRKKKNNKNKQYIFMERNEIEEKVREFLIDDLEVEEDKIAPEALLKDDLGIDSLDFVDIVVIVEKKFGFKIKPEEMAGVKTLNDFCDYIQSKVG